MIAVSDEHEVVQQVQELYASFVPVDPFLFSLEFSLGGDYFLSDRTITALDHVVEGISSLLLSLKWKPTIRFQRR
jgi:vacuolar protein sorting-associated protein 45